MSTRDKSDFGSGKILPDELPDGGTTGSESDDGSVHPERPGAVGPDVRAAERSAAVEHGAHLRRDGTDAVPDEPVDAPHAARHARPSE
ncbi:MULTISPECIES: hypothetical protein [Isoptericola]|uniref:hypothetical protein n=1 Tax=Isoptericola TaxID=254250 RepID=UPI00383A2BFB